MTGFFQRPKFFPSALLCFLFSFSCLCRICIYFLCVMCAVAVLCICLLYILHAYLQIFNVFQFMCFKTNHVFQPFNRNSVINFSMINLYKCLICKCIYCNAVHCKVSKSFFTCCTLQRCIEVQ